MEIDKDTLDKLIKESPWLICRHNPDGSYVFVNPASSNILGYEPSELIGRNPYEFFHPADQESIRENSHSPALEGSQTMMSEYRFRRKSGEFIWLRTYTNPVVNASGQVDSLVTSSMDVTDVVTTRQKLEHKEEILEEAGNLSAMGAWEFDLETQAIHWTNGVFKVHEMDVGPPPDFETLLSYYKDPQPLLTAIDRAVEHGETYHLVMPFVSVKGRDKWLKTIGKPVLEKGKVVKLIGVVQDITDEVKSQEKNRKIIEGLQKQKQRFKDLNHILTHNLRSPVSNLQVLLDVLEEDEDADSKAVTLAHLRQTAENIRETLGDLVEAVQAIQAEGLEMEKVDIKSAFNRVFLGLKARADEASTEIKTDFSAWDVIDYPKVYLESIFLNLLSNAIKYGKSEQVTHILVKTILEGGRKGLVVQDDGIGMDLEKYGDRVFAMGRRLTNQSDGKGVGLFFTKEQIEAMDGTIEVESSLGKGSTFKVLF